MPGQRRGPVADLTTHRHALEAACRTPATIVAGAASIRRLATQLRSIGRRRGLAELERAARAVLRATEPSLAAAAARLLAAVTAADSTLAERDRVVLLVDDDVGLSRLFQHRLRAEHREVLTASDRERMLAVLAAGPVDLLVLDLNLGEVDGREILAALRGSLVTVAMPVIVVTAERDPWVEAECRALGATDFLSKPVDAAVLAARVTALLGQHPAEPPARAAAAASILLAEPDPLTARILEHRLTRSGMRVRTVASGRLVLEALDAEPPDLLVADSLLPGIDGIELARRIRRHPTLGRIPVIVLSTVGDEEVIRALGVGADDSVRKPVSPAELVARINRLLSRPG